MLKITSHKIAQIENFQAIQRDQLRPDQQWCAVCGTPIVDMAYLDYQGYAGKGTGAVLCPNHAYAASQSATNPLTEEPQQQQEEEMVEPFPR